MMDVLILREILSPWSTTSHIAHARVLSIIPLQIIQIGNEQYVTHIEIFQFHVIMSYSLFNVATD